MNDLLAPIRGRWLVAGALALALAACNKPKGPSGPVASVPAASGAASSGPVEPGPSPAPTGSGTATSTPGGGEASLELTVDPARAAIGTPITLSVRNTGGARFVFHHPGGSSGCDGFRWTVSLQDGQGMLYTLEDDHTLNPPVCAAVIIPPSDIVIEPGQSVKIPLRTDQPFYVVDMRARVMLGTPRPKQALPPGEYTVAVAGVDAPLMAKLELLPR